MTVFDAVACGLAGLPVAYLLLVAWPLARIDLREHRLPNALTLPGLWLALAGQTLASLVLALRGLVDQGRDWPEVLGAAFANQAGALVVAAVVFAFSLAAHVWAGLGMGDVKLLTVIALSLGWFSPWSPLLAVVVGLATAVVVVVTRFAMGRIKLNAAMALGPYLLVGFAVAALVLGAGAFVGAPAMNLVS